MNVDSAIAALENELTSLGTPTEGSSAWWLIRAKSLGLSYLKVLKVQGIDDPKIGDQYRKDIRTALQTPDAVSVSSIAGSSTFTSPAP